jgi:adenylate cyclase
MYHVADPPSDQHEDEGRRSRHHELHSLRGEELAAAITRRVGEKLLGKFRGRPAAFERLAELGLVDGAWLEHPPEDPADVIAHLRDVGAALSRSVRERPSLLADLDLTAVEVLSAPPATPLPPDLPRRDLTVVFTDLEGFTAFTDAEGDAAAGRLLAAHDPAVERIVHGRGGRVVKRLGDGHLLAFERPEAGVLAAVELLEASPSPLRLRSGAHAGEVMAPPGDVLGHVVNVAARVTDAAAGGEALVTGEIRDRIGGLGGVVFEVPVARDLRGIEVPVPVCSVHRG